MTSSFYDSLEDRAVIRQLSEEEWNMPNYAKVVEKSRKDIRYYAYLVPVLLAICIAGSRIKGESIANTVCASVVMVVFAGYLAWIQKKTAERHAYRLAEAQRIIDERRSQ